MVFSISFVKIREFEQWNTLDLKTFINSQNVYCFVNTNNKDFINSNGWTNSKANGKMRLEGKDYIVKDGEVLNFRFNT